MITLKTKCDFCNCFIERIYHEVKNLTDYQHSIEKGGWFQQQGRDGQVYDLCPICVMRNESFGKSL